MSRALAVLFALSVLCGGCAREPLFHDQYPGQNVPHDLRAGEYERNVGYAEPLAWLLPVQISGSQVPDQPWSNEPMEIRPVNPGVSPVASSRLAALLPGVPAGWSSEEANGVTLRTPVGELTEASRNYWKGAVFRTAPTPDGRDLFPSVGVTIIDKGQTGMTAADPRDERSTVTLRPVTVEGFTGDEFDAGPAMKQVQVEVGGRYLVRVRGGHVPLADLRAWAARVKLKELAELK